jgi:hypothetical protein
MSQLKIYPGNFLVGPNKITISLRLVSVPVETRTNHLSNSNRKVYRLRELAV